MRENRHGLQTDYTMKVCANPPELLMVALSEQAFRVTAVFQHLSSFPTLTDQPDRKTSNVEASIVTELRILRGALIADFLARREVGYPEDTSRPIFRRHFILKINCEARLYKNSPLQRLKMRDSNRQHRKLYQS